RDFHVTGVQTCALPICELIEGISARLTNRFGRGFGKQNLWRMRQFYVAFPRGSTVRDPRILAALRRQSEPVGSVEPPGASRGGRSEERRVGKDSRCWWW